MADRMPGASGVVHILVWLPQNMALYQVSREMNTNASSGTQSKRFHARAMACKLHKREISR